MQCVTAASRHQSKSPAVEPRASSGAMCSAAPEHRAVQSSIRCGSKVVPISRLTRLPGPMASRSQVQRTRLASSTPGTSTIFGVPVEPEVVTA